MDWDPLSPFAFSPVLLVGGNSLVPRSCPGPPAVRELIQVVYCDAWKGRAVSVSGCPNKVT